jgi:macrolide-specific efflux system membrane fusion protein
MMRGPESNREMILLYLVPGGTWVKKGTVVAQIDAQSLQDHVDDLTDTIEAAEADIRKRRAEQSVEWETLQQTVRVNKAVADKAALDYGGAEVRTEIEKQLLKLSLDETEARYKQSMADLDFKKASMAAELRVLELTRDRHTRHRDRHARDILAFTIRAPMDGLAVIKDFYRGGGETDTFKQGDRVFPGQRFMQIVDTGSMQVEGSINQTESSHFRVGQKATITLDAFPGLQFPGTVHSIGALATGGWRQQDYVRNIPVRIKIEGNDPRLIPDLSAGVNVEISREESATLISRSAIQTDGDKQFALVKSADGFQRREIQIGAANPTHAAVLSGLRPGEVVRLN